MSHHRSVAAEKVSSRTRAASIAGTAVALEAIVLVSIVLQLPGRVLPEGLATQIGHNSEAFALAILLTLGIAWHRSVNGVRSASGWLLVAAIIVVLVVIGLVLLQVSNPRLKTLNEAVFGAAALTAYCSLPRRPRLLWLVGPGVLLAILVLRNSDIVVTQAESLVALVLAPLGFDLFDRGVVRRGRRSPTVQVLGWAAFLAVSPFVLMGLRSLDLGADLDGAVLYAARGNEAFWGLFMLHVVGILAWDTVGAGHGGEPAGESAPTPPAAGVVHGDRRELT